MNHKRAGSLSSFSSYSSGDSDNAGEHEDANNQQQSSILSTRNTRLDAVFDVITAVDPGAWELTKRWTVLVIVLDLIQLFLFIIHPVWGWPQTKPENSLFWRWFHRIQLQNAAAELGYSGFLGVFYFSVSVTWATVAALVAVGYCRKQGINLNKWFLRFLRPVLCFPHELFFLSLLAMYLVPLSCDYWGRMVWRADRSLKLRAQRRDKMIYFPEEKCFDGGGMIHAVVAVITLIAHLGLGMITTLRRFEPNLAAGQVLGYYNVKFMLRRFSARVLMVLVFHLLTGYRPEIATFVILLTYYLIMYYTIRRFLFTNMKTFMVYSAAGTYMFYASIVLFLTVSFSSGFPIKSTNSALWAGLPFALIGFFLARWRRRSSARVAALYYGVRMVDRPQDVHHYGDVFGPECPARCALTDMSGAPPTASASGSISASAASVGDPTKLAEDVTKVALLQFPEHPHMIATHASVLAATGDFAGAQAYIEKGRKILKAAAYVKFMLHVMKHHTQEQADSRKGSGDTMDILSYVEFQNAFRLLHQFHKRALRAGRDFWRLLLHHDVRVSGLIAAVDKIHEVSTMAETNYRAILERYPKSVKLLRAYGRFVVDVRSDPWAAQRLFAEADKLEDNLLNEQLQAATSDTETAALMANRIDESSDAVCTINTEGTVTFANRLLCRMFGYRKAEIEGRNISSLMPSPFNSQHNTYLRNYMSTGKAKILNKVREVVAIHRDKFVFPVTILVTKVNQGGQEGFMGVIRALPDDNSVGKIWLTRNGAVACLSRGFSDLLGYKHADLAGKQLRAISPNAEEVASVVDECLGMQEGEERTASLSFRHRYGDELNFSATYRLGGTEGVRLVVLYLRAKEDHAAILTVDGGGRIVYANAKLAQLIGCKDADLKDCSLTDLLPPPLGPLHAAQYLRQRAPQPPLPPCLSEQPIRLLHPRTLKPVYVTLQPKTVQQWHVGGDGAGLDMGDRADRHERLFMYRVAGVPYEDFLLQYRLQVAMDLQGNIMQIATSHDTFGYTDAAEMYGKPLGAFLTGVEESLSAVFVAKLVEKDKGRHMFRADWLGSTGATVPAVIETDSGHAGEDLRASVYRADRLSTVLFVDRATNRIVRCLEMAQLVLGFTPKELVSKTVPDILPSAMPNGKVEDLLADEKKKGGLASKSKALGTKKTFDAVHKDGRPLQLAVVASENPADPGEIALSLRVTQPQTLSVPEHLLPSRDQAERVQRQATEKALLARGMSMKSTASRVRMAPKLSGVLGLPEGRPSGGFPSVSIKGPKKGARMTLLPKYISAHETSQNGAHDSDASSRRGSNAGSNRSSGMRRSMPEPSTVPELLPHHKLVSGSMKVSRFAIDGAPSRVEREDGPGSPLRHADWAEEAHQDESARHRWEPERGAAEAQGGTEWVLPGTSMRKAKSQRDSGGELASPTQRDSRGAGGEPSRLSYPSVDPSGLQRGKTPTALNGLEWEEERGKDEDQDEHGIKPHVIDWIDNLELPPSLAALLPAPSGKLVGGMALLNGPSTKRVGMLDSNPGGSTVRASFGYDGPTQMNGGRKSLEMNGGRKSLEMNGGRKSLEMNGGRRSMEMNGVRKSLEFSHAESKRKSIEFEGSGLRRSGGYEGPTAPHLNGGGRRSGGFEGPMQHLASKKSLKHAESRLSRLDDDGPRRRSHSQSIDGEGGGRGKRHSGPPPATGKGPSLPALHSGEDGPGADQDGDVDGDGTTTNDDAMTTAYTEGGAITMVEDLYGDEYDEYEDEEEEEEDRTLGIVVDDDFMQAKRFKRILRVFESEHTNSILLRYGRYARWALLAMALAHIAGFAVVITIANLWKEYLEVVHYAAEAPKLVYQIMGRARVLNGLATGVLGNLTSFNETVTELKVATDDLSFMTNGLYLGFHHPTPMTYAPLKDLYNFPKLTYFVTNMTATAQLTGLWDLSNMYLAASRQLIYNAYKWYDGMHYQPDWNFLQLNGLAVLAPAMNVAAHLQIENANLRVGTTLSILLAAFLVEVIVIIPACTIIVFNTVAKVAMERHRRFGLFMAVPVHVIQEIATRELVVGDDDDEDEDEEARYNAGEEARAGGRKLRVAAKRKHGGRSRGSVRLLTEENLPVYVRLLWPLMLWLALVVVVLSMAWILAGQNKAQLNQIYSANLMEQTVNKLWFLAIDTVCLAANGESRAFTARADTLRQTADDMYSIMVGLAFGNASLSIPARGLQNKQLWAALYDRKCWRDDLSTCYPPGHPYYPSTQTGADNIIRTAWNRAVALSAAAASTVVATQRHFVYLFEVLQNDAASAAGSIGAVFESNLTGTSTLEAINAALLAVGVLGGGWYYIRSLRPFLRTISHEATLVASLLSKVHRDFDVEALVSQVYAGKEKEKSGVGATGAAGDSRDGDEDPGDADGGRGLAIEDGRRQGHGQASGKSAYMR